jgi:arginine deiminase
MPFHVSSEVGRLRQVIMHRPEPRSDRAAARADDHRTGVARAQHDVLAGILTENGVQVHDFAELLTETLDVATARSWLLERILTDRTVGPELTLPLRWLWETHDSRQLAASLIGGVRKDEVPEAARRGLSWETLAPSDDVLPPLPDHRVQRRHSVLVYGGVCLATGNSPFSIQEHLYSALYRFHPMFAEQGLPLWYGDAGERSPSTLDGGDVQVLGRGRVLAAVGGRTTAGGVEQLASNLFRDGGACVILVVESPGGATGRGLDDTVSMVDRDVVMVSPNLPEGVRSWTVRPRWDAPDPDGLEVVANDSFLGSMRDVLGLNRLTVLTSAEEPRRGPGDRGRPSHPFLVVEPGTVICDERNHSTNSLLERRGIEVVTVAGSELAGGRGGPRGLTCVIERDAV